MRPRSCVNPYPHRTNQFRAALYAWKHEPNAEGIGVEGGDGGGGTDTAEDPSDCIPLQLQRLFGQLQMSDRTCIETRALTDSFGWTAQVGSHYLLVLDHIH